MGMILPIESAMVSREKFTPILSIVMFIFTGLCALSGALGYMAYGDNTQVMVAIALSCTFGSSTLLLPSSFI